MTLQDELDQLNNEVRSRYPGYYVRCTGTGILEWELVGPDKKVHYRRDTLEAMKRLVAER